MKSVLLLVLILTMPVTQKPTKQDRIPEDTIHIISESNSTEIKRFTRGILLQIQDRIGPVTYEGLGTYLIEFKKVPVREGVWEIEINGETYTLIKKKGVQRPAPKKEPTITLTDVLIGDVTGTTFELTEGIQEYFAYEPKQDITAYEVALFLPLFAGPSYGQGEYYTGGAIVPLRDRHVGGWPAGTSKPVLVLGEWQIERLGSAMRHLRKLPSPSK